MGDKFSTYVPDHEHQCVQPYTIGPGFGVCAQRSAYREPARAVEQLGAAHAGPARGDELGHYRRERFGCAVGGQREGDEFEAICHVGRRSADPAILAEVALPGNVRRGGLGLVRRYARRRLLPH